ncbi:MAG: ATP-dependent helicase [Butyrivibrio sp.]|nr:ATP-dependent helicase [Butyrivibrio sp.]
MNNNSLNAAQHKAVCHTKGPAMILAGPGSGKTFVIVRRLQYLIEDCGIDPSSILVITFTKAAAIEMQYRFTKLTDSAYPEVSFGTFHSVFYRIIKDSSNGGNSKIEIATEKIKYEIIRDVMSFLLRQKTIGKEEYENALEQIPEIISEISRLKNMGEDPLYCSEGVPLSHCFKDIYEGYNRKLMEFGKIDFDDMIARCYEILKSNRSILTKWQRRFEYILIDEYQDINRMQYKVVRLLAGDKNNLFVVGDDDQSIYGFRGSDPLIMLGFEKEFPGQTPMVVNLNMNYRCGKEIINAALPVIEANTLRYKKQLTADDSNGPGKVIARRYESKDVQNLQIVDFLKKHMDELDRIAILYRTNSEAKALSQILISNKIPTNLEEESKALFEEPCVVLCGAYISFACGGKKRGDFYRIMNQPMRYISRDCAKGETVKQKEVVEYYKGNSARINTVKKFFREINMLEHLRPALAVRFIRKSIGIDKLFPGKDAVLDEFLEKASDFEDMKQFLSWMESEKEKTYDEGAVKRKSTNKSGKRVKLLTMHGSKGLEFDIVWLPDLNEGIIPARSAVTLQEIEEERRMLYVAMTRAKQALIMSYVTGTKESPMMPTRFLRPIKELWDKNYKKLQTSSEPSSGSSTSSSNSASSR